MVDREGDFVRHLIFNRQGAKCAKEGSKASCHKKVQRDIGNYFCSFLCFFLAIAFLGDLGALAVKNALLTALCGLRASALKRSAALPSTFTDASQPVECSVQRKVEREQYKQFQFGW
ncbi:MAG: hypothetical protein AB8C95_04790 [Phycisphaeraceae bacterium]